MSRAGQHAHLALLAQQFDEDAARTEREEQTELRIAPYADDQLRHCTESHFLDQEPV